MQHDVMIVLIIIFSVILYILNKNRPRSYGDISEVKSTETGKLFLIDTSVDIAAKHKPIDPKSRVLLLAMYCLNCPKCNSNRIEVRYDRDVNKLAIKCNDCGTTRFIDIEKILL